MDQQNKEPSKTLIYVSNLPFDTNDEQFKDLFKGFNIKTAYVARRKNGKSKGFGFVNLEKESEQNAAIEKLNGKELNSRKLIARIAFNDDRRNEKGELKEEFKTQQNNQVASETVVYVSNLEWSVKDEDLKKIFAEFNPKVATVAMRRNGRSKGFGFVEFNNKEDREKALSLDQKSFNERTVTVKPSTGYKGDRQDNNNQSRNNRRNNNRNDNRRNNNFNNRRNNNNNYNNNRRYNDNNDNNNRNFNVVRRNERNERKSENTLYISNLPFELDDNDLKQIFSEFHPKNAHIPTRRNGKSKGYGFVEFNNSKDQNEALRALDQSEVNGRLVTIKVSTPNRVTVRRNVGFRNNNNNNNNRRYNDNNNNNNNNRRYNDNNDNYNRSGNRRNFNNNNRRNNNNNNNNNNDKPKEVSTNMVYVSNLPFAVDDKGLEEIFKGLKLTKAYVAKRRNGYSKGFGFVEFSTPEDQQKAIKYNNNEINGRTIVVQAAFKVENKTN